MTTSSDLTPAELGNLATLASLDDEMDDGMLTGAPPADDSAQGNYFPTVYAFVCEFLAPTFAHNVSDQDTSWRWCSRWFHHVEAMARLEACWKAWEVLRLDAGAGASLWFRDHADPCMSALTAPEGPFSRCSDITHKLPLDLPTAPLPTGLVANL